MLDRWMQEIGELDREYAQMLLDESFAGGLFKVRVAWDVLVFEVAFVLGLTRVDGRWV